MTSRCTVAPAFGQKLATLPIKLRQAAHDGMNAGMMVLAREAQNQARWQADGTDNGHWIVTGSARVSLTGYVLGEDPNYPTFDYRDAYHVRHHSPTTFPSLQDEPSTIVGVLTLAEDTSGGSWGSNLQKYETEGASTMSGGEPVTVQTMRDNKDFLWALIATAVQIELRS
jgi:hypothetical protein